MRILPELLRRESLNNVETHCVETILVAGLANRYVSTPRPYSLRRHEQFPPRNRPSIAKARTASLPTNQKNNHATAATPDMPKRITLDYY